MSTNILRRMMAESFLRIRNPGYQKVYNELSARAHWPVEQLRRWQLEQLKLFLTHCYENVPFYSERFETVGFQPAKFEHLSQLETIPVLTKTDIRDNYRRMVANGVDINTLQRGATGGSTGVPVVYYKDDHTRLYDVASVWENFTWMGIKPGDRFLRIGGQAYIKSTKRRLISQSQAKLMNYTVRSVASLSPEYLDELLALIRREKPVALWGYASGAYLIARHILDRKAGPTSIKAVITSSEVLQDFHRDAIREAFGVEAFDGYGGGDTVVACECRFHNGMHTSDSSRYIELVDDNGHAVASGEYGRVLVTNFNNRSWPYVRYDMGDLAMQQNYSVCECGVKLPRIGPVQGRTGDFIRTVDGKTATTPNFTLVFKNIIDEVRSYQIVQEKLEEVIIKIVASEKFTDLTKAYVEKSFRTILGENIRIVIELVEDVEVTVLGKRRIVISRIK